MNNKKEVNKITIKEKVQFNKSTLKSTLQAKEIFVSIFSAPDMAMKYTSSKPTPKSLVCNNFLTFWRTDNRLDWFNWATS